MAIHFGGQSKYSRAWIKIEKDTQAYWYGAFGFAVGFFTHSLWSQSDKTTINLLAALFVLVLIALFFWKLSAWHISRSKSEEWNFIKGIRGESKVYYELKRLSDDFYVFQDVKLATGGNIDFVVLSLNSVFSVEVKSIQGKIWISNDNKVVVNDRKLSHDPVSQAWGEAKQLEEESGVPAISVLVLAGKVELKVGMHPIRGVYVVGLEWLNKLILEKSRSETLAAFDRDKIVQFLRAEV